MRVVNRILVLEDDTNIGPKLGAALGQAGYSPLIARSTVDAVRQLASGPPFDVVLLELPPAEGDGLKLLESIKSSHPQLPVIVISNLPGVSYAVSAMKKGAYDYLDRSAPPEELLAVVGQALEHRETSKSDLARRQGLEKLVEARTELLRQAIADLERSYDITLEALGNALDLKDAETEGHSKRVTAYSIVLARAMNIEAAGIKVIARGAFLHDIGKMAIPDAILSKPGRLDPEEQAIMREHCLRGYTILKKIPFLEQASEIVFSHQEHFDGSGYSRGLKGEEIPLGARIFSVADALDAITSDRPYRKAKSFADARQEIERCCGTQFDPQIVAIYRELPDRLWEDLRAEVTHPKSGNPVALGDTLDAASAGKPMKQS